LSSSTVSANTINVTGNNFSNIQHAVNIANDGDILNLGNKTFYGYNNTILINKNNLIIQGSSPSFKVTLNANNNGSIFQTSEGSYNITFKNINFYNGNSTTEKGAAINAKNTINVENCTFTNNKGASGAAIYLNTTASNSIIIDSTFNNNNARYNNTNSEYPEGGAIDSHASNTLIQNCSFTGNSAIHDAGAVSFARSSNNTIINSTFTNNNAVNNGGAISIRLSELTIINSTFQGNSATIGSAIYNDPTSTLNMIVNNTTFSNNRAQTFDILAPDYIFNQPGFATIQIALIVGNNVLDAIYNEGYLTINNTIPTQTEYAINQSIRLRFNNAIYTNTNRY
jgi:hypothetical protein